MELNLRYLSTRGEAAQLGFGEVLLAGLAADGGLYTPLAYPHIAPDEIAVLSGVPYAHATARLISPYLSQTYSEDILLQQAKNAYSGFRHQAIAPLVQIDDNLFVLELFHGPTLAFKDIAMQLLARMMNYILEKNNLRATIVAATSGDTGAAAIEAFRNLDRVDVFILYPDGRVSDVQRRQMTTVSDSNIHTIALNGTFDDAQNILKRLFRNAVFREKVSLAGVNSINWARVVAQMVYYFTSGIILGAPHRHISFSVPTGNFGDVLAGYVAKKMGLPISRLIVATNANDILVRALATGRYEPLGVTPTQSPSMDIQVSSNFERLLFDACGRDHSVIRSVFGALDQSGSFDLPAGALATMRREFDACSVSEVQTTNEIQRTYREAGYILDPHTATGVHAARAQLKIDPKTPVVALATAHAAKFPQAISRAIGLTPKLPTKIAEALAGKERFTLLDNNEKEIMDFICERARAVTE